MGNLTFLGVKKSLIKKLPIIKQLFELRDYINFWILRRLVTRKHKLLGEDGYFMRIQVSGFGRGLILDLRKFPSSDLFVFDQIFNMGCYHRLHEMIVATDSENSIGRIVDAGANVGCSVLCWGCWFPKACIVAIEPDLSNLNLCLHNAKLNNISTVRHLHGALWSAPIPLVVERDFRDNRDASITVRNDDQGTVQGVTLASVMLEQGWDCIDILKIDIEGAEAELVRQDASFVSVLQRTRFLAVEIHEEFISRGEVYCFLEGIGFSCKTIGDLTLCVNRKPFLPATGIAGKGA